VTTLDLRSSLLADISALCQVDLTPAETTAKGTDHEPEPSIVHSAKNGNLPLSVTYRTLYSHGAPVCVDQPH